MFGDLTGGDAPKTVTIGAKLDPETARLLKGLAREYEGNVSLTLRALIRWAGRARLSHARKPVDFDGNGGRGGTSHD